MTTPLYRAMSAQDTPTLVNRARQLARVPTQKRDRDHRAEITTIHWVLEDRYPDQVKPVMDRWAMSTRPLATYTETLIGAIPAHEKETA